MMECEICKRRITKEFTWVNCRYWSFHPIRECGGCVYPVGNTCIKKVPKEFHRAKDRVRDE